MITSPNLFLAGFEKCGTTSLANWLGQHPLISCSMPKEPKFFVKDYHKGMEWYMDRYHRYSNATAYILDACHMNSTIPYALPRIKESCDSPKFIFLIRDPVQRAYSAWNHFRNMRPGREEFGFSQAIDHCLNNQSDLIIRCEKDYMTNIDPMGGLYLQQYVSSGYYWYHISRCINMFGAENVAVELLDSLAEEPELVYDRVVEWLELDGYMPTELSILNVSKHNLDIHEEYPNVAKKLMNCYYSDITLLSDFLGIDLITKWWKR